jgi:hypothetical protein
MKYRFFYSDFEEIKEQFKKNYDILHAKDQKEFQKCVNILKLNPFEKKFGALILDYFILYDILIGQENIDKLKKIEKNIEYIVVCGPENEMNAIIQKLKLEKLI